MSKQFENFEDLSTHLLSGGKATKAGWKEGTHIFMKCGNVYIDRFKSTSSRWETITNTNCREVVIFSDCLLSTDCSKFFNYVEKEKIFLVRYLSPEGEVIYVSEGSKREEQCISKGYRPVLMPKARRLPYELG
jgi:hypothetical protein